MSKEGAPGLEIFQDHLDQAERRGTTANLAVLERARDRNLFVLERARKKRL